MSQQESKRQPLHSEMGTSPLSPGSLGPSWTILANTHNLVVENSNVQINVGMAYR